MMILVVALIAMVVGACGMRALDVERYGQLLAEGRRNAVAWRRQAMHAAAVSDRYWLYISEVYERTLLVPLPLVPLAPLVDDVQLPDVAPADVVPVADDACVLARVDGDRRVCLDPACDRCFGTAPFPPVLVALSPAAGESRDRPRLAVVEVAS